MCSFRKTIVEIFSRTTGLESGNLHEKFLTYYKMKLKSWPWGLDEAIKGETVFTCLYRKMFLSPRKTSCERDIVWKYLRRTVALSVLIFHILLLHYEGKNSNSFSCEKVKYFFRYFVFIFLWGFSIFVQRHQNDNVMLFIITS
jgi:hypothetical protein